MENTEFNIPGEIQSGDENLITDLGSSNPEEVQVDDEINDDLAAMLNDDEDSPDDGLDNNKPAEKDKPVEEPEKPADKKLENTETTPFEDIVAHFQSKGILGDISEYEDEDFKFDGSEESFTELFERKTRMTAIEILEKEILPELPKSARKQIELMLTEDLDANSADELGDKIASLSEITKDKLEDDIELAKKTYTDYLKSKGFDDDEIESMVRTAVDLEEIVDKADKAKDKLLKTFEKEVEAKKEQAKVEEQRIAEANKKRLETMKSNITAFRETLNKSGLNFNPKIEELIYKSRTEVVGQTDDKKPLNKIGVLSSKDPEGFQNALHLLSALEFFSVDKEGKVKPNFNALTKVAESKATKKIANTLENVAKKFGTVGTRNKSSIDESDDDVLDELKNYISE